MDERDAGEHGNVMRMGLKYKTNGCRMVIIPPGTKQGYVAPRAAPKAPPCKAKKAWYHLLYFLSTPY